mmetsp:Transcript_3034/g.5318  ORF Transcript_3034/g.5318 Transcript_3034/m.5318 type:complete len:135 (+) Transcript_3034:246-650(+)
MCTATSGSTIQQVPSQSWVDFPLAFCVSDAVKLKNFLSFTSEGIGFVATCCRRLSNWDTGVRTVELVEVLEANRWLLDLESGEPGSLSAADSSADGSSSEDTDSVSLPLLRARRCDLRPRRTRLNRLRNKSIKM